MKIALSNPDFYFSFFMFFAVTYIGCYLQHQIKTSFMVYPCCMLTTVSPVYNRWIKTIHDYIF